MKKVFVVFLLVILPGVAYAALVNINTADEPTLETLPGIGPTKAQAIIDYRTQHGPFARIEDIQNVSGIGPSTFEQIKSSITVGESPPPLPITVVPPPPTTGGGADPYAPPPSSLALVLEGPTQVVANAPATYRGRAVTKQGNDDLAAQLSWSFGDGSSQTGTVVEKVYRFPGTYLLTVQARDGFTSATNRLVVGVTTAQVSVSAVTGEGVTLTNHATTTLSLSRWLLVADAYRFRLPEGMEILAQSSVFLPTAITHLPPVSVVSLAYPDGTLVQPFTPPPSLPLVQHVAAVPETNTELTTQPHVDALVALTAAKEPAAVGASVSEAKPSLWWLYALGAVIVVGAGAFILM